MRAVQFHRQDLVRPTGPRSYASVAESANPSPAR